MNATINFVSLRLPPLLLAVIPLVLQADEQAFLDVFDAVTPEPQNPVAEISTRELQEILKTESAIIFDSRPFEEYAIGHIPGAVNLSAKPGVPMSVYVSDAAELDRLLDGDRSIHIVLYCNGPYCGRSKRLAAEFAAAGYEHVRRYQLGIPVWRALGGTTVIEPAGLRHVHANDGTAVFIDTRGQQLFSQGTLERAVNLPHANLASEILAAHDDGRLPAKDHNTRIIVFGNNAREAREVAEALTAQAFHNVAYFDGSYEQLTSRPVFGRRL